ncbi:phospho-N-acetylmuramoyl-pentapeptide-transferase [Oscillatoria amoena NRMC-F 0135]|nr:phospho-N-acetylmuramoyl-pentapeptide-transferase [Oscillatoria amoena NRMC-F 0135]
MLYYLYELKDFFGGFNVFQYGTFRMMMAALTALLLSLFCGPWVIRKLLSLKIGQPIRSKEEVHKLYELHGKKMGTPTMGGLLILGAVIVSTLLWARPDKPFVWQGLLVLVVLGALGFYDDYQKVVKKNSKGVSARMKLVVQFGIAVIVGIFLISNPDSGEKIRQLFLPFVKTPVMDMGIVSLLFFALVMTGSSNAVNLTDGLDGLAIGCTITVAGSLAIFSYLAGQATTAEYLFIPHVKGVQELSVMCAALVGAGLGFLWYNCHPAKVFMGDTGSLAIGGFLGYVAICIKQEFVLVIIGGIFVIEALSVILQVASFKLTGKRIFAMSPIHHHFELKGWNESTVVIRFWILSIIFALVGFATLKLR